MIKTNKRMTNIAKDIAEKTEARQELNLIIETVTIDKAEPHREVDSTRGLNTAEARLTARHKNRDKRNLGKEKSQRMHWQAACKIDRTTAQKDRRKKNKEAKKNAKAIR